MFAQSRPNSARLEQEFGRPIEFVIKCEDFKSNFARKFSDSFISRTPAVTPREVLELLPDNKVVSNQEANEENIFGNVSKRCNQQNNTMEQENITSKTLEKSFILNDIRKTEENALNIEVETLRWQLAQTEANRQMHIELLKQIVSFLNKVKDHVGKNSEAKLKQNNSSPRISMNKSFNSAHIPRSRSVFVVNNNKDYPTLVKRSNSRRISKSINDVNGHKECALSSSKLSLICDTDDSNKLKEEMTRLINLAHSVLSTKLPDLTFTYNDNHTENNKANNTLPLGLPLLEETKSLTIKNNLRDEPEFANILNNKNTEMKGNNLNNYLTSSLNLARDGHDTFKDIKLNDKKLKNVSNSFERLHQTNKKIDFGSSSFVEDESGFSSMNSFQEIGIPIINIVPASPNKELPYIADANTDKVEESKEWMSPLVLDEQNVKVFWV